jgi:hypothetical protein
MPVRKFGFREEAGPNRASAEAMAKVSKISRRSGGGDNWSKQKQHQNGKHAWADREYLHVEP